MTPCTVPTRADDIAFRAKGIVRNKMIYIAGQVDLDERTQLRHPGSLTAEATGAMEYVARVLGSAGADVADLVKLTVFYVGDGTVDEDALLHQSAGYIGPLPGPGPAITAVPLQSLAYPGMLIEIEGIAMRHPNGQRLPRVAAWSPDCHGMPHPFSHALRCEELIFTSGTTARDSQGKIGHEGDLAAQSDVALRRLKQLLRQLGTDLDDVVKINLFDADGGTKASWEESALIRAAHYRGPGPAATGIAIPSLRPAGVNDQDRCHSHAMRGMDGSRLPRNHVWPDGH
jgi:enamine deaminase RidA (YjgF/YER057c/UK114 family)